MTTTSKKSKSATSKKPSPKRGASKPSSSKTKPKTERNLGGAGHNKGQTQDPAFAAERARKRELYMNMTDEERRLMVMEICDIIATSERGVVGILRDHADYPSLQTFWIWLDNDATCSAIYARAKKLQAEFMAEYLIDIADDSRNDFMEREAQNGTFTVVADKEVVNRSRLRVDTRKWLMSRFNPKKYGERMALANDPDNPLTPPQAKVDLTKLTKDELKLYIALQSKVETKQE